MPSRLLAIGDIHGDLDALLRILLGLGLIGSGGRWAGGESALVLMGDLNDRGPDSLAVMHAVMGLEQDAAAAGGAVHTLLGNHELLAVQGDYRYVRAVEVLALEHWWYDDVNGLPAVYQGNSPFARWIRTRPTMLQVRSTLFVHAGIDRWALEQGPAEINEAMLAWVRHFQGIAEEPAESTWWLNAEADYGPVWTDRFQVLSETSSDQRELSDILPKVLGRLSADRLVVGHKPTKLLDYRVGFPHPAYGASVAVIDTGISSFYQGRLSALEITEDRVAPHYFDRGVSGLQLTTQFRAQSKRALDEMMEEKSP